MRFPDPSSAASCYNATSAFSPMSGLLDGSETMAHCANPGSTLGLAEPGAEIWLLASADTKRKLAWS
jgi:sugar fermentation stimulation protein A